MLLTSVQPLCSHCLIIGDGVVEMVSGGFKKNIGLGKEKDTGAQSLSLLCDHMLNLTNRCLVARVPLSPTPPK